MENRKLSGYEYAVREIERSEQFIEDDRIIREYCRKIREERNSGKEAGDERQIPDVRRG